MHHSWNCTAEIESYGPNSVTFIQPSLLHLRQAQSCPQNQPGCCPAARWHWIAGIYQPCLDRNRSVPGRITQGHTQRGSPALMAPVQRVPWEGRSSAGTALPSMPRAARAANPSEHPSMRKVSGPDVRADQRRAQPGCCGPGAGLGNNAGGHGQRRGWSLKLQ